jgi:hypothetical protein
VADRRPRHAEPSTYRAVVHTGGHEIERSVAKVEVVHYEHLFPNTRDGVTRAGCYPDARLAAIV